MNNKQEFEALFDLGCADLKLVEKNIGDREIKRGNASFSFATGCREVFKGSIIGA
jgi:hypothetical protein